jgi:hypothetical protein
MKSNAIRLLLPTLCLAAAFWTPSPSLAFPPCPPDYCGAERLECENTGGRFTQTYVTVCSLPGGGTSTAWEGICEYTNAGPWGDACYGI